MGTAKRERQKANRALKLEQQAKQERVEKVKRTGTRWLLTIGGLVLVIIAILWASGAFGGDDTIESTGTDSSNGSIASGVSTTAVTPIETAPTFPPVETPTVEVPETPPTKLTVKEIVPGEGPKSVVGDTVTVYYVGVTTDGVAFDNSYETGRSFPVTLGQNSVIQGWEQGLVGLQKGGRYQLDIPSDLGYGATGSPPAIGPDEPLFFVIDVLDITTPG